MFTPRIQGFLLVYSILLAGLVLGTAGFSVLDIDIYRPVTPEKLLPGALSQDVVSLAAAIGLIGCALMARRGWAPAWPVWLGLVAYLFYAYALYAFEDTYNAFYLAYVAIAGGAVYAMILFFYFADLNRFGYAGGARPPRRSLAVLFVVLVALFLGLWLSILLPATQTHEPPVGGAIFVLDLAFTLPLLTIAAVLLWREAPLGDVLALPLVIKVGTLGISVFLGTLFGAFFGLPVALEEVAIYALLGFGPLVFVPLLTRGLKSA